DAAWVGELPGYIVVRGVCDYCDGEKGNVWQGYAAVAAAAYTRALLGQVAASLPSADKSGTAESPEPSLPPMNTSMGGPTTFLIGGLPPARPLAPLEPLTELPPEPRLLSKRSRTVDALEQSLRSRTWLALAGTSGTGKTQLAALLARRFQSVSGWVR